MIDRVSGNLNEKIIVDTTSNTATILVVMGSVIIKTEDESKILANLGQEEIYTLPIQSGKYVVEITSDNTLAYIFRIFVY